MNNNNKRRKPLLSCLRRQIRRIIASNDQSSLLTNDNSFDSESSSSSDNNDETYKPLQTVVSNNFEISTNKILSNNDDFVLNNDLADSSASDSSSDHLILSDEDSNLTPSHNNSVPNELNRSIQHLEEFESSLRVWAINNNITHSALSQLLVIFVGVKKNNVMAKRIIYTKL
ncbi:unnamed protein product [Macrosiphum euphorbiae]|uniref:Uncharacterized protein n=1 Tax=Macrosiphum euphorbiae TaxID=13131 RepID=A0AAV0WSD8_9HEMI|nr:unnamed protein product [Macrosiphum euphorbiae]